MDAMKTVTVRAIAREKPWKGWWATRRFFPCNVDVVMEVVDGDADPTHPDDEKNEKVERKRPHPSKVGQRSLKALKASPSHLLVFDGGELPVISEPVSESQRVADLEREVRRLTQMMASMAPKQKAG